MHLRLWLSFLLLVAIPGAARAQGGAAVAMRAQVPAPSAHVTRVAATPLLAARAPAPVAERRWLIYAKRGAVIGGVVGLGVVAYDLVANPSGNSRGEMTGVGLLTLVPARTWIVLGSASDEGQ